MTKYSRYRSRHPEETDHVGMLIVAVCGCWAVAFVMLWLVYRIYTGDFSG